MCALLRLCRGLTWRALPPPSPLGSDVGARLWVDPVSSAFFVFPCGAQRQLDALRARICDHCAHRSLVPGTAWVEKAVQLFQIQQLRHGVMMVGPSGSGKSTAWRILLDAMTSLDGVKGESYVIDPKAISKEQLYGTLGTCPSYLSFWHRLLLLVLGSS